MIGKLFFYMILLIIACFCLKRMMKNIENRTFKQIIDDEISGRFL